MFAYQKPKRKRPLRDRKEVLDSDKSSSDGPESSSSTSSHSSLSFSDLASDHEEEVANEQEQYVDNLPQESDPEPTIEDNEEVGQQPNIEEFQEEEQELVTFEAPNLGGSESDSSDDTFSGQRRLSTSSSSDNESYGDSDTSGEGSTFQEPTDELNLLDEDGNSQTTDGIKDVESWCEQLFRMKSRFKMSKAALYAIWQHIRNHQEVLGPVLQAHQFPSYFTFQGEVKEEIPTVYMDCAATNIATNEVHYVRRCTSYPWSQIPISDYRKYYTLYYVELKDLVAFHEKIHKLPRNSAHIADIGLDGMPATKSGGVSVDVLCVKFKTCRKVYTLAMLEPVSKGLGLPDSIIMERLICGLQDVDMKVDLVGADAPKRATLLGQVNHNGVYGCQYCFFKAAQTQSDKEKKTKGGKAYWPTESMNGDLRTEEEVENILQQIEDNPRLHKDERKGIKKRSILKSIDEDFDTSRKVPAERMHLVDLGVFRKCLGLTFSGSHTQKTKAGTFRRISFAVMNKKLSGIRTVSESSRRTRPLDIGHWKAQEFRNLLFAYFPVLIEAVQPSGRQIAHLYLILVFVARAYSLPTKWYELCQTRLVPLLDRWYYLYEAIFGPKTCVYNVHTLWHLPQVREMGDLCSTACYKYEGEYGYLKQFYEGGTPSMGLQAIQGSYQRTLLGHSCVKQIALNPKVTTKRDDTWIFVEPGKIVKMDALTEDKMSILGRIVNVESIYLLEGINFNEVLVYKFKGISDTEVTISVHDVQGKGVLVDNTLSILTNNMLRED